MWLLLDGDGGSLVHKRCASQLEAIEISNRSNECSKRIKKAEEIRQEIQKQRAAQEAAVERMAKAAIKAMEKQFPFLKQKDTK